MRRLLRFRLWHLLLLTAVVAAAVLPVANIRRQLARERHALHEARMMGASAHFGPPRYALGKWFDRLVGGPVPTVTYLTFDRQPHPDGEWGPYGPRGKAVRLRDWTPENVAKLGRALADLPDLESLAFRDTKLRPGALQQLAPPSDRLLYLGLPNTDVRDADILAVLPRLPKLERLDLSGTDVSDGSMAAVARLPNLELLRLEDTRVTDSGLAKLRGLKRLEVLDLGLTRVTEQSLRVLVEMGVSQKLLLPARWPEAAVDTLKAASPAQSECEVRASAYEFSFRPDAKALTPLPES
jgi:hypothetical protein